MSSENDQQHQKDQLPDSLAQLTKSPSEELDQVGEMDMEMDKSDDGTKDQGNSPDRENVSDKERSPDNPQSQPISNTETQAENADDRHRRPTDGVSEDLLDDRKSDSRHSNRDDHRTPNKYSDSKHIIQVTNISPAATIEQMTTLFKTLGEILDIALFHFDNSPEVNFKVCFVEFSRHSSVLLAQHLTNTIFIDRALIVLPYDKPNIPTDKETVIEYGCGGTEYVTTFNSGVVTQVATGPGGVQVLTTTDPRLTALGLQLYPQLPINTDPTRLEEIRRTLYIGNLDSKLAPELVLKFFNDIGEVKYIRIAGDENLATRFAFVEYNNQSSIANALQHNGYVLGSRALKINHSNNPIVKPPPKLEIEDAFTRKLRDRRTSPRDYSGSRNSKYRSSKSERTRDRDRGYYDRRMSPRRDSRSRRSRSRDRDFPSRSRRSRSPRGHSSRRSRSREDLGKSSRSKRRRSRSRSTDRKSRHKSSRRH